MKYFEVKNAGIACTVISVAGIAVGGYFFFRYGLALILPFLIGWGVALIISPIARRLSLKTKTARKFWSFFLMLLLLGLIVLLLVLAVNRLFLELQRLLERIGNNPERVGEMLGQTLDYFESITSNIPFLNRFTGIEELNSFWDKIDDMASEIVTGVVRNISTAVPIFIGSIVRAFPSFLLFVVVTIISCFYFCSDIDGIHASLTSLLPRKMALRMPKIKKHIKETAVKYLRAYVLLLFMTFGELFVGFSILGIDYALILALLIAIIDILPVLGVGSVLIPWSVVLLISGNYYRGIGLLIIYACIAVVRQFSEPKIVGGSIGLHPLVTLVSMYSGFKLLGITGMLIGPAVALTAKSIINIKASCNFSESIRS